MITLVSARSTNSRPARRRPLLPLDQYRRPAPRSWRRPQPDGQIMLPTGDRLLAHHNRRSYSQSDNATIGALHAVVVSRRTCAWSSWASHPSPDAACSGLDDGEIEHFFERDVANTPARGHRPVRKAAPARTENSLLHW